MPLICNLVRAGASGGSPGAVVCWRDAVAVAVDGLIEWRAR